MITSITDIPNDQGGRVYLSFQASFLDNGDLTGQSYSLFRYDQLEVDSSGWVSLSSIDAIGDPSYTFEAETLMDSTSESDGYTEFKIVASMNNGIFHSNPMMGYSVDNIAPEVPGDLIAVVMNDNIILTWSENTDSDFEHFILEKSTNMNFLSSEIIEISEADIYRHEFYCKSDELLSHSSYGLCWKHK